MAQQNKNQQGSQGSQGSQGYTEKDENMNRPGAGQGATKENRGNLDRDDAEAGNTSGQSNPSGSGQQR